MNYRQLGRYGVKVSEVAVGGWLTHGRTIDDDTTSQIVHRAIELGINFFDTADVYNRGEAELALAKAIKDVKRESLFIATKCYFPMSDEPNDQGLSRKHIMESAHNSLKRLELDYVDLYQCHRNDMGVPVDETVRAMDDLIKQGKILYWGVSEWPAYRIAQACHTAKELGCRPPVSNQPVYHMMQRYIEKEVLPACAHYGLGQVVFSPLAQGILTGKYLPGQAPPEGSRGADEKSNMFMGSLMSDENLTKVQALGKVAKKHGCSLPQFALAWCLRQQGVSAVIVGATKPEQVEQNASASGLSLPDEAWAAADAALGIES
ncbi:MAG TPA: aldo/keto reductase family protein [Fimbriimonadaceae bacterium]|nr:aldo/keto reductase family protein [Fimbriimonadaceae bacterium]